jgi:hypothetical protein
MNTVNKIRDDTGTWAMTEEQLRFELHSDNILHGYFNKSKASQLRIQIVDAILSGRADALWEVL